MPDAVESVNPVPYGETARIVDLKPLQPRTILAVIVSEKDPHAADGAGLLLQRLRDVGLPRRSDRAEHRALERLVHGRPSRRR